MRDFEPCSTCLPAFVTPGGDFYPPIGLEWDGLIVPCFAWSSPGRTEQGEGMVACWNLRSARESSSRFVTNPTLLV